MNNVKNSVKKWRKMTPEERQKAREEARAKWDSMSDAEKDAAREHFRSYYHAGGYHYYEATANTATIKVNTAASTEAAIMAHYVSRMP